MSRYNIVAPVQAWGLVEPWVVRVKLARLVVGKVQMMILIIVNAIYAL
jgi:hypothetical protein